MPFAELLARSAFSFLRGASTPEQMVERAKELELDALALCDRDGLYGIVRAFSRARELGQRLIVGAELSLAAAGQRVERAGPWCSVGSRSPRGWPAEPPVVVLLARDGVGYANLCRLVTLAHAGLPKGHAVLDLDDLASHHTGLVAIVPAPRLPCAEEVSSARLFEVAREALGRERAFLGAYRRLDGLDAQRMDLVLGWARRYGLDLLASARPLFHDRSHKPLADVLWCIRHGTTLEAAGQALEPNAEALLRSEAQMRRLFSEYPDWVDRSAEVASELRFSPSEIHYAFPCELEPGQSADAKLAELTWRGARRRYPEGVPGGVATQLERELALIEKLGVAPYFSSTHEIVEMARRRGILCQGRGSAANSAVCYVLGITAVDPARSNLLFERFLSEERQEPPDIDIDFEHERREEIIQEIYQRWGRERAAMVSEVIRFRAKSALREVGKVFGLSAQQAERLGGSFTYWEGSAEAEQRLAESGFDLRAEHLQKILELARKLERFPRHLSVHVGGFVISARPLYEVAPLEPARMALRTVIPWDKDDLETLGFFKIDVLGLGMLTAIRKTLALIHATGGLGASLEPFDPLELITRIPPQDAAVYAMLSRADSIGVFQIESRAQMAMLPRLRPRRFYDLVIQVAIVRPGPIQGGMVHPYLRRRSGQEPVTMPHEALRSILERTLGVPLFQEQVMQLAIVGAGYGAGEADQLRRDMAAWKKTGRLSRHRERLLEGFARRGIDADFAAALFEQIKGFGEYGFPESHAASFALLVYVSAWQKVHFPAHFACALLNSQPMGFYSPSVLVRDARAHGVEVRDVSVLHSDWDSTLEPASGESRVASGQAGAQRALRLGLRLIRGLGEGKGRALEQARRVRPFADLQELRRRTGLDTRSMMLLAEAGALAELEPERHAAVWQARLPCFGGLFAGVDVVEEVPSLPVTSAAEQLVLDYERKGLSIADHPLRHLRARLRSRGVVTAQELQRTAHGTGLTVAGLVLTRQRPGTSSGVVFVTLEDETGMANLVLYARVFEAFSVLARHAKLLLATGRVERHVTPLPPGEKGAATAVVHLVVSRLERLDGRLSGLENRHSTDLGTSLRSRDFR